MTTLTEDLAVEKLQRMNNDELLAHLIERLPAIRAALDGGAVSQDDPFQNMAEQYHALIDRLWKVYHKHGGKADGVNEISTLLDNLFALRVPQRDGGAVSQDEISSIAAKLDDYPAFDKSVITDWCRFLIAALRAPQQQPSSERDLALNFARFYRSSIDAVYEEYDTIEAAYDAFLASCQEKKE